MLSDGPEYNLVMFSEFLIFCQIISRAFRWRKQQQNMKNEKNIGHIVQDNNAITSFPEGIYLFKVNNRNTRTRCEISPKLTTKTPERPLQWGRSGVFIVNFKHIWQLFLVFLFLTLNM